MARNPYPARSPAGMRSNVVRFQMTAAQTFKAGELVKLVTQKVSVCTTAPTAVLGVACDPAVPTHLLEQPTYINVYLADDATIWAVSGSSDPANTNIGVDYGAAVSSNVWTLDLTNTTQLCWRVVDIDTEQKLFFVKFVSSIQQVGGSQIS